MSNILYNLIRRKDCVPGNPVVVYQSEKFHIIDNTLIYNRLLIAKCSNIGMIHIIVCEDSDMFITR